MCTRKYQDMTRQFDTFEEYIEFFDTHPWLHPDDPWFGKAFIGMQPGDFDKEVQLEPLVAVFYSTRSRSKDDDDSGDESGDEYINLNTLDKFSDSQPEDSEETMPTVDIASHLQRTMRSKPKCKCTRKWLLRGVRTSCELCK